MLDEEIQEINSPRSVTFLTFLPKLIHPALHKKSKMSFYINKVSMTPKNPTKN